MDKKNIRLAVVGSRSFDSYSTLEKKIDEIVIDDLEMDISTIVSGGARGADSFGERYADKYAIDKLIFPAEWKKYGPRAGFIRNVDIIKNCDVCICFWDGESHGTKHDIELCEEHKKLCIIYNFIKDTTEIRHYEADNQKLF